MLSQRATFGLARAREGAGQGSGQGARRSIARSPTKWPDSPYAAAGRGASQGSGSARRPRTSTIGLPSYEPPRPMAKEPGTPGVRPDFLKDPLDEGGSEAALASWTSESRRRTRFGRFRPTEPPTRRRASDEAERRRAAADDKPADRATARRCRATGRQRREAPPPQRSRRRSLTLRHTVGASAWRVSAMSGDELSSDAHVELVVGEAHVGARLDWFLAQQFPNYSRVMLRKVINAAGVKVDGKRVKAAHRLRAGERVDIVLPELAREGPQPENIPLDILYEDDAPGRDQQAAGHGRPSGQGPLVRHADRRACSFTSTSSARPADPRGRASCIGSTATPAACLIVAKTDQAHMQLAEQFESRTVEKEYFAMCAGVPNRDRDMIDLPVGAHPYQREKMAIRRDHATSREAQTFYEVVERFDGFAALKVLPKTGRTHQIRLHLASIGCPGAVRSAVRRPGDDHARRTRSRSDRRDRAARIARRCTRGGLKIRHPGTGEAMEFVAPLPADIEARRWHALARSSTREQADSLAGCVASQLSHVAACAVRRPASGQRGSAPGRACRACAGWRTARRRRSRRPMPSCMAAARIRSKMNSLAWGNCVA